MKKHLIIEIQDEPDNKHGIQLYAKDLSEFEILGMLRFAEKIYFMQMVSNAKQAKQSTPAKKTQNDKP